MVTPVHVLSFVEIDVPHCSLTYGVPPCTASIPTTGSIKCFNSLGTCQDRVNFTDAPITLRFAEDVSLIPLAADALPLIKSIDYDPTIVSLNGELGQRATLKVIFRDAPHSDAGPDWDKYAISRNYTNPYQRGTFWGKFRARNPFLRGRNMRLIRGTADQAIAAMETRHFIIESIDGPTPKGEFSIIAKDALKFADGDRAVAPLLSGGFLTADITAVATTFTISPAGIGASYPSSGYAAIGGNEIVSFSQGGNDANTLLLLHMDQGETGAVFTDSSPSARTVTRTGANAEGDTGQLKFGVSTGNFGGDFLTVPDSNDWTFSGAFTIDCWIRVTSLAANRGICAHITDGANNFYRFFITTTGALTFDVKSAGVTIVTLSSAAGAILVNTWYHVAISRTGTTWTITKDGVAVATVVDADAIPNFTSTFRIGAAVDGAGGTIVFQGNIDEFRVSNVARWSFPFTPPSDAYTAADTFNITRAQLNTVAVTHSASDRVQLVLQYIGANPANIIADLLQSYADVPGAYIPLADWQTEVAGFLGTVYTLNICEPTSVADLISELLIQMGAAMWWDDLAQLIRLQVLRAVATEADRWNEDNVLESTIEVREQPEKRISQVIVYFGQINPLLKVDEKRNYRSTQSETDLQSEADEGSAAIKLIFARGIAQGGRTVATRIAQKHLSRFVRAPRRFELELMRFAGQNPQLGAGIRLGGGVPNVSSWPFQDETGARVDIPVQVTRVNAMADKYAVEAEEMLFTGYGADIDPTLHTIVLDSNESDINLRTRHDELYAAPVSGDTVTLIIASGAIIGSSSTTTPALDIGAWPAGVTVNVHVNGRIQGAGGVGGGIIVGPTYIAAGNGGLALLTGRAINLILNTGAGQIWGGGGGGGSGGGPGMGGGGGAGYVPGLGGVDFASGSDKAQPGTTEAGGAGTHAGAANGGVGGGPGLAGGTATGNVGVDNAPGAAGGAINGLSFCTKTGTGDIRGSQIN
jgi:Concanavalin A-like lectin/glucanases superfamily